MLSFGHEGILYRRSFMMYDKETDSLWVHATGEAVKGAYKGKVLTFLPSQVMPWGRWKKRHPGTSVLTGQRGHPRMALFELGQQPEKYGLSIGQGKMPKLYPISLLSEARVINDVHEERPIVLLWDADSKTAQAFERGKHTFVWKDGALLDEAGGKWDALRGLLPGALPGEKPVRLKQVVATTWLMERWQGFYPHGETYQRATK